MKDKEKIINTTACILMAALFVVIYISKLHTVLSINVPRELREMNMIAFAKAFSEGRNLYLKENLALTDPPVATSLYGLLVPLISSPFVRLFSSAGISALTCCELLAILIEITGCIFAYKIVMTETGNRVLSMGGALLICSCYWRYAPFGGAFPDQWGLTGGLILTYLIGKNEKKGTHRPVLYALILVALFYIKQYFAFWAFGAFVFLLLRSVKEALRLALCGIISGIISVIAVYMIFPLYFAETLPIAQGSTGNNDLWYSVSQIPEQVKWTYKYVVVIAFLYLLYLLMRRRNKGEAGSGMKLKKVSLAVCQSVCVLPLCIMIARNEGTRYTYYLQLWWPYVILATICVMPAVFGCIFGNNHTVAHIAMIAVLVFAVWDCLGYLISRPLNVQERDNWNVAYKILAGYPGDKILVSPHLSGFCMDNGIPTADYGQAEFNSPYSLDMYKDNKLFMTLFPEAEIILNNNISYNEGLKTRIANGEFSCIALTDSGNYWLEEKDILSAGYRVEADIELAMGNEMLPTRFYVKQ